MREYTRELTVYVWPEGQVHAMVRLNGSWALDGAVYKDWDNFNRHVNPVCFNKFWVRVSE